MTKTKTEFLEKWLPLEVANCPPFILDKLGKSEIQKRLSNSIEESWNFYIDPTKLQQVYDYCMVKGATLEDYTYRWLKTPIGELLASIRFVGGDLTKPAVFVLYKDFELNSISEIKQLGAILKEEYRLFSSKRIRWYTSQEATNLLMYQDIIAGDLAYYAGFIDELQTNPKPHNYDQVKLVQATTLDWYEQYKTSYEEMYQQNPVFREMASIESKDVLQEMKDAGCLYEIIIAEQFAGIIGTCLEDHKIFSGHVIYEEFLFAPFRGKRFAPAVQRHLIERLSGEDVSMLYGTIHRQNIASIKTAERTGRKWVGGYLFAKI